MIPKLVLKLLSVQKKTTTVVFTAEVWLYIQEVNGV